MEAMLAEKLMASDQQVLYHIVNNVPRVRTRIQAYLRRKLRNPYSFSAYFHLGYLSRAVDLREL